ncbi:MAG: phenylalanine--tRNA ligase subunit beta, partial [Actinobacteria bacterium]|nr:phenylalanine--tRNA ligase subunit beta [Actinomycetota bacterium]
PDRGYALSIRGAAREIAGALDLNFIDPVTHAKALEFKENGGATPIKISDGAMVAYLRSLDNFNPKAPSPIWLSRRVEKVGMRSISLAVDVTNYVMIELGQPFDPIAIAKNSRRHKLSTEASRRLERGVDPSLAEFASGRAAELMIALGGATYVGTSVSGEARYPSLIDLDPKYVNDRLGTELSTEVIEKALTTVGCDVNTKSWKVDPPSWRGDLQIPADLVEEVARIVGYDQIPSVLPRSPYAATLTPVQLRRRTIAAALAARGLTEVQNFPFVAESTMKTLNYTGERAATFRIANPMSEETPLMRTHLIPGLIGAAQRNLSRGARDFALFEIGAIFRNTTKLVDGIFPTLGVKPDAATIKAIFESVPPQPIHLGAIFVGKITGDNWRTKARNYEWADAIAEAQTVLDLCGLSYTVERSDFAPWHPGRCAELLVDGKAVAHAGELHPRVCKIGDGKISLAFTLSFRAPDRTLTGEEISAAREAAVANASKLYGATVRS